MKLDLQFQTGFRRDTWSWGNELTISTSQIKNTSIKIHPRKITEIPLILIPRFEQAVKNKEENIINLRVLTSYQFRGRKLTTNKIMEALETFEEAFKDSRSAFIYGKGYIGYDRGTYIENLLIVTAEVNEGKVNSNPVTFKIYISPKLKILNKGLYAAVTKNILNEFDGDVIVTQAMGKYFGIKVKFPKFDTVGEQQGYLKQLFAQTLSQLAA